MTDINLPAVVKEVTEAFIDYERALLVNEMDTLDHYFWDSEHTVRYGVAENLYGAKAIADYRRVCVPVGPGRELYNTVVSTFGEDYATVSTQFRDGETARVGRQMQTWALTAGFIGKFYIIGVGVESQQWWLLGALVLGSAIGVFYYLRVMVTLFLVEPNLHRHDAPFDWGQRAGGVMLMVVAFLAFFLGVYPQPLLVLLAQFSIG